jgi:hypothetical protein
VQGWRGDACICCTEMLKFAYAVEIQNQERVRNNGREGFSGSKEGYIAAFKVSFRG